MKKCLCLVGIVLLVTLPNLASARDFADKLEGFHAVLSNLYDEMMPLCKDLIDVGKGIAGFAALWYIASRVWRHLANAEPIDFYPLFRPFVLGFCIVTFDITVLGTMNGLLKPIVTGTATMVEKTDDAVAALLKQKEQAIKNTDAWKMYVGENATGNRDLWYRHTYSDKNPDEEGPFEFIGNQVKFIGEKMAYNLRNTVKQWMNEVLQILFQAASLCINTMSTFQRIVLSILGPLVFGLAVFDGFAHTLTAWLAKYINVYMWLPVANIFGAIIGKIQVEMLKLELGSAYQSGESLFSATDTGYLVFMIIGIVGYFTVPSVAGFVVNAGGGGAMLQKITSMATSVAGGAAGGVVSRAGQGMSNIADAKQHFNEGLSGQASGTGVSGMVGRMAGNSYIASKIAGSGSDEKK
ncbi:conjugative transposon TraJ protein [Pedobacter africanus]|uniref:conjugative transposon protein TraJ n=1 Tax=Pedobacter africanus TaxID=151894 RepID=UPI0033918B87